MHSNWLLWQSVGRKMHFCDSQLISGGQSCILIYIFSILQYKQYQLLEMGSKLLSAIFTNLVFTRIHLSVKLKSAFRIYQSLLQAVLPLKTSHFQKRELFILVLRLTEILHIFKPTTYVSTYRTFCHLGN